MMSTMVTSGDAKERMAKALTICDEHAINQFDRQIFSGDTGEEKDSNDEKFGIALARKIKKQSLLKPAYSKENALIIAEAQSLTLPAQQALLKLLEEPPEHTVIIITADREQSLLPTIASRCLIIRLQNTPQKEAIPEEITKLIRGELSIGERLVLAEKIMQDNPGEWVKNYIFSAREHLLMSLESKAPSDLAKFSHSLLKAQKTYELLNGTNINQRLIIEEFLLNLA